MVAKSKKPYSRAPPPKKSELLFQVGKEVPKWYSVEKPTISPSSTSHNAYEKYDKDKCEQIYRSECELYRKFYQQDQSSDYQWLQTSLSTTAKVNDHQPDPESDRFQSACLSRIVLLRWLPWFVVHLFTRWTNSRVSSIFFRRIFNIVGKHWPWPKFSKMFSSTRIFPIIEDYSSSINNRRNRQQTSTLCSSSSKTKWNAPMRSFSICCK